MSKNGGHQKVVKKSFNFQLLREMRKYRLKKKLCYTKVSAFTGIPEKRIGNSERTGNMDWFEMAKLLYFYDQWFEVKLIDDKRYIPDEQEFD